MQEEVRQESLSMIPDTERRLATAWTDLKKVQVSTVYLINTEMATAWKDLFMKDAVNDSHHYSVHQTGLHWSSE